jgi:ABC-type bacteriocin/lantibiotic exporter with double-glycine peptidase domain
MTTRKAALLSSVPLRAIFGALPHKGYLVLLGVLAHLPGLVTPVLFGHLISTLSGGATSGRVYILACGILLFALVALLVAWGNERLSIQAFAEQERHLKDLVWNHVQDLPILVRDASSPGVWMQKLSRDVPVVQGTCRMLLEAGLGFLVFFFGTLLLVLWKAPSLSTVFVVVIVFAIATHRIVNRGLKAETRQLRECFYRESEVILGLLEMLPILGSFGVTSLFKPLFLSSVAQTVERQIGQQKHMTDFKALIQAEIWGVRAVVLLTCTFLFLKRNLQIGDIVMYDMLIAQMLGGLSQVMFIMPHLDMGLEYATSLRDMLSPPAGYGDASPTARAPASVCPAVHADGGSARPTAFRIESVTFRYAPDSPPVIADFSTCIRTGEFVCFLGRNGTGKSTLAKLLSGAYEPQSGSIDSSDRKPGIVPQHIVIYRDSLLENVRLRDETITESRVETTLRRCGFSGFLEAHLSGLHTNLSPGSCSGGELRTLGIARALVRNPETLILDELTNNLDVVAKEAVYSVLAGLRGQCTIILITHDISCIELADRVFVFRRNGISEINGSDAASRTREALQAIRGEA